MSDNGDDSDGNTEDDVTETPTPANGGDIEATKTSSITSDVGATGLSAGDTLTYTISIANTGNLTLTDVGVQSDTLERVDGTDLSAVFDETDFATPAVGSWPSGVVGTLAPGQSIDFTATYSVTQDDVDAGGLSNSATAVGTTPDDTDITDVSDNGDDSDGNTEDDVTVDSALSEASVALVKTATFDDDGNNDGFADAGETVTYTFTITNTGNVTVTNIDLTDLLIDDSGAAVGSVPSLAPGASTDIEVAYLLTPGDIASGSVTNTATATGNSPTGTDDVSDTSGTAVDNDTPTDTNLPLSASLALVTTADFLDDGNSDGFTDAGETVEFTYTVTNTSSETVTDIDVSDLLIDPNGAPIGNIPSLAPGESATLTAVYMLTDEDLEAGFVENDAEAIGDSPTGTNDVSDISGTAIDNDVPTVEPLNNADIDAIEEVLSDDLEQTITTLSRNVSSLSQRAADRLSRTAVQCAEEINDLLKETPIRFASDSFFIDQRNTAILDQIARELETCPSSAFRIEGHTDSDASESYNIFLSQNRVDAVKDALIERGVADERLDTFGYGETRPIATNTTSVGKALNRRVEFIPLDQVASAEVGLCSNDRNPFFNLSASTDGDAGSVSGDFGSNSTNCFTGEYRETWGELNVTMVDGFGDYSMANLGTLREKQSGDRLRGWFVEGYLSKYDVSQGDAVGDIFGLGVHAGLYGADRLENDLVFNYYGSAALGRHNFDLTAGDDVDGHYTYGGLFTGAALSGDTKLANDWTFRPRAGIDLAFGEAFESGINVPDVDLNIDTTAFGRGFAEAGFVRTQDDDLLTLAPRAFCSYDFEDSNDFCGWGARIAYETFSEDASNWTYSLDYEGGEDYNSFGLRVSHGKSIFNDLGLVKSQVTVGSDGAYALEQNLEVKW